MASPGYILAKQKLRNKKKPFSRKQVEEAAAELGRQGGLVGGIARAKKLSDKRRRAIAIHAANVRWGNITPFRV
jgi:hypothetical protein